MTREQIEEEIDVRLEEPDDEWDGIYNTGYSRGFRDGAQWRINSVWHDAIDKPERNRDFLYESARGWFGINNTTKMAREVYPEKWDRFVEGYDVIRWVYIDDILTERKEETE